MSVHYLGHPTPCPAWCDRRDDDPHWDHTGSIVGFDRGRPFCVFLGRDDGDGEGSRPTLVTVAAGVPGAVFHLSPEQAAELADALRRASELISE